LHLIFFHKIILNLDDSASSIYIFGGQSQSSSSKKFDDSVSYLNILKDGNLSDSSKMYFRQMPQPRSDHCSVGYAGNFVFIIGGQTTGSTMLTQSLMYNIGRSNFVNIFSLSRPRLNPVCNIVGTKIVIAGGSTQTYNSLL